MTNQSEQIQKANRVIRDAEAILIGAGAGLSTGAGFTYSGERFTRYFADAERRYGFHDMYSGGFYSYPSPEAMWAVWSRNIYVNRYMDPPKDTYQQLLNLVREKDYFVLTTNVDHCFQKAGFDKDRLFYTQGDYGLFQCSKPCHQKTYDNVNTIRQMVLSQGFTIDENGNLCPPKQGTPALEVPGELIAHCPVCGRPMGLNLRSDDTFVEDEDWHRAAERYSAFVDRHAEGRIIYLEIGVGYNTPGIIKYPFWRLTWQNDHAEYIVLNAEEQPVPKDIENRTIQLIGDSDEIIREITSVKSGKNSI